MAVYAIGDVQGCYQSLRRLLDKINFDQAFDKLWFCGDLVNRGSDSLATLRFIKSLGDRAVTVLGNHDLHLLAKYHSGQPVAELDTLHAVLKSPDCDELMVWLQSRPLLHFDSDLQMLLVHAGIHPRWSLQQARQYAAEIEQVLTEPGSLAYFTQMYGDLPDRWSEELFGMERKRCITNVLTRMRFFSSDQRLDMKAKGGPLQHPELIPWYLLNQRPNDGFRIVFGHWSTLPVGSYGCHFAIDGGCVWGGRFAALQVDLKEPRWTSISCDCYQRNHSI
ncbi:MAG: symmetrical bis(5'-nucleosyl)-tetraphosphatase [Gammaproteobacteria bacterium]|nr:symmetrical bis(5'-nucleosyl)-tetraphosphatase [Gammaproteobacteria bacterium]